MSDIPITPEMLDAGIAAMVDVTDTVDPRSTEVWLAAAYRAMRALEPAGDGDARIRAVVREELTQVLGGACVDASDAMRAARTHSVRPVDLVEWLGFKSGLLSRLTLPDEEPDHG